MAAGFTLHMNRATAHTGSRDNANLDAERSTRRSKVYWRTLRVLTVRLYALKKFIGFLSSDPSDLNKTIAIFEKKDARKGTDGGRFLARMKVTNRAMDQPYDDDTFSVVALRASDVVGEL
jgi:hypothetical protein